MSFKKNHNKLKLIFPNTNNIIDKLLIDNESLCYISFKKDADKITSIIKLLLKKINIAPNKIIITDATAGVGGNSISFARNFKKVNSIEIDYTRYNYLTNNIKLYKLTNVVFYNADCISILHDIKSDVVYFDPPWGGKNYKLVTNLRLSISGLPLENICIDLFTKNIRMIVLKLPNNYDMPYLYNQLCCYDIHLFPLKKMKIVVILN